MEKPTKNLSNLKNSYISNKLILTTCPVVPQYYASYLFCTLTEFLESMLSDEDSKKKTKGQIDSALNPMRWSSVTDRLCWMTSADLAQRF